VNIVFIVNHVMSIFLGPLAFCWHCNVWSNCHGRVLSQTFFPGTLSTKCTMFHNGRNVSQCFAMFHNIVKHCETLCDNVEKQSSTHVHRTAAWDRLSPESSVGVLHFQVAGGCFNVASLRDRGQQLPFLVTPPHAQARQVTHDPCSHAGRLQPVEDSESAGSVSSFRLHRLPLGPRAIWATMFHNDTVKHCETF
jgi:hypothetical protein